MGVDLDVPACEVAGPEDGAAEAGGEVETDGDARGGEERAQVVTVLDALAAADDGDIADAQGDAAGCKWDAGGGEDAPPVGVAAGEGGLDQGELAMERATRSAAASLTAPLTSTSMMRRAPSSSVTMSRARARQTTRRARMNERSRRPACRRA